MGRPVSFQVSHCPSCLNGGSGEHEKVHESPPVPEGEGMGRAAAGFPPPTWISISTHKQKQCHYPKSSPPITGKQRVVWGGQGSVAAMLHADVAMFVCHGWRDCHHKRKQEKKARIPTAPPERFQRRVFRKVVCPSPCPAHNGEEGRKKRGWEKVHREWK